MSDEEGAGDHSRQRTKSFADKARAFRRRTTQTFLVKLGKADSSADEEFAELTKRFFALDCNLREVQRDLSKYIEAKRAMLMAASATAEDITPIFDRQAPLRHVAVQFKDLQSFMDTSVRPVVDAGFLDQVMDPVEKQLRQFDDIKMRIEKRGRLMLDYDSYRRKVKAIAEKQSAGAAEKKAKKEAKLADAWQKFSSVNERLLEELQIVDENKSIVLQRPLVALLKLQSEFYQRAHEEFKKVKSILEDPAVEKTIREGEQLQQDAYTALGQRGAEPMPDISRAPSSSSSSSAAGGGGGSSSKGSTFMIENDDKKVNASPKSPAAPVIDMDALGGGGGPSAPSAAASSAAKKPPPPTAAKDTSGGGMGMGMCGMASGASIAAGAAALKKTPTTFNDNITANNNNSSSAANNNNPPRPTPSAPKPAPPPAAAAEVKCKALYPYEATAPTELSLDEGDVITVLKQDDSGWWQGQVRGKVGWFPFNYVELVK